MRRPDHRMLGRRPRRVLTRAAALAAIFAATLNACDRNRDREGDLPLPEYDATVPVEEVEHADPAAVERERHDPSWRTHAEQDRRERLHRRDTLTVPATGDAPGGNSPETTPDTDTAGSDSMHSARAIRPAGPTGPAHTDIGDASIIARLQRAAQQRGRGGRPPPLEHSVLRLQVLLDRANFSPGAIDGRWGKNTEKALYWFQHDEELEATGFVDEDTLQRLLQRGRSAPAVAFYDVRDEDVAGPFAPNPPGIYEKAELELLAYESPLEQIAERFRTTPALLRELNPDVDLDALRTGTRIQVPNTTARTMHEARGEVAWVLVSHGGHYTHALDEDGEILYHFPSTLGSRYAPTPIGQFHVADIVPWPRFHYTPELFDSASDGRPDAVLPPGPNSPIGVVWIGLSAPTYGIHGTNAPETIGSVTSHGCVRLTNWDARTLAERIREGTPVVLR